VGIAEEVIRQQFVMASDLRLGVEPSAGEIEIDMILPVDSGIIFRSQVIKDLRVLVLAVAGDELTESNV
jgi:hypothetical protein